MNPQEKQEMERLRNQVTALQSRLDALYSSNFPDEIVRNLVRKGMLRYSGIRVINYTNPSGKDFYSIFADYEDKGVVISVEPRQYYLKVDSINTSTDTFTLANHGLADTTDVTLVFTGGAPSPLVPSTIYYIRDATANTFKLAATPGGAAIDITTVGSGLIFIKPV